MCGQITSNPIKIGRNHRDIATQSKSKKYVFHDHFDVFGSIFLDPQMVEIANIGQITGILLEIGQDLRSQVIFFSKYNNYEAI